MTPCYQVDHAADLSAANTMALACQAATVVTLHNEPQIESLFQDRQLDSTPLFVLSGGSNVLLPTQLDAVVIRPLMQGIAVVNESEEYINLEVMAGVNWHQLVLYTVNQGWFGLENLALIPGLTGAAPVQNIGAYGVQLDERLTHVKAFHLPSRRWHRFDKSDCQFGYRDSIFKQQSGEWLISRVGLQLHKNPSLIQAGYGDVQSAAMAIAQSEDRQQMNPADVMKAIIGIRQRKLPDPTKLPNCGSFFKNPVIPTEQFHQLKSRFPEIVGYRVDDAQTKVAAGWLIDNAGLKGDGIAPIFTHHLQALVLTNHSEPNSPIKATQSDIANTQHYLQQKIFDKYAIALEREPVWIEANGAINLYNALYRP